MIESPRVSIIMPYLRAEATIARAIESVLAQTEERIELITIGDGSTDGSRAIAEAFALRDPRVRVLWHAENRGPSFARNRAIEAATGEWIAVLDADDWFAPQRLQVLLAAAGDEPVVVDNLLGIDPDDGSEVGPLFGVLPAALTAEDIVAATVPGSTYNFGYLKPVYRKAFTKRWSLAYDEKLRTAEDMLFLLECCLVGGRIRVVDAPLYRYNLQMSPRRRRISNTTHSSPMDREVASALHALRVRRTDSIDRSIEKAIGVRIEFLENGADASSFRHFIHRRRFMDAFRLFGHSSKVRSYVFETILRKARSRG